MAAIGSGPGRTKTVVDAVCAGKERQFNRRFLGLTAIFVSHNLAVIRQVSDQIAVMRHGSLVEYGEADQVFGDPRHDYTKTLIARSPTIVS